VEAILNTYDLVVVGGGIVGVSTALQLKRHNPDAAILLIEKEARLAQHQTGHNSGVVHAGVYYQPGSLKADFCKRGAARTIEFCREHGLPFKQIGKLLVATDAIEYERMGALEERCGRNGIDTQRLSERDLIKMEPAVVGMGALLVPATGITDYRIITAKMAELFTTLGGGIKCDLEVKALREGPHTVEIELAETKITTKYLVVCGGLMADRLAKKMGIKINFQIVPFRGEYYRLAAQHDSIVEHLVYPIPDPALPFLGVHLTPMIGGFVTVGPNAVLSWKREGYGRFNFDLLDSIEMLKFPGFWPVIRKNFLNGLREFKDSMFKHGYLQRVRKYCPGLTSTADLLPYPPGIRAQAVQRDGTLVEDFLFAESDLSFHVCNAPSPAATSAIPIGEYLCGKVTSRFGL
jgi:(S)-2-hydroxyglutarate dehydrogenase